MNSSTRCFRILVADDDPGVRRTLATFLIERNHEVATACDGIEALRRIDQDAFDLLITDALMPRLDALGLIAALGRRVDRPEIIVITGMHELDLALAAMRGGAADFFTKPFNYEKVGFAIERLAERRRVARFDTVNERELEFERGAAAALARAIDERDRFNIGHGRRVAAYSVEVGRRLSYTPTRLARLELAARLHDVGKIAVDDGILNKPGRLDENEMAQMRRHSEMGEYIIKPMSALSDIAGVIRSHHERWDGMGYPDGIAGDEIPLDARIICIADFFDAVTSKRPYRDPMSLPQALDIVAEEAGRQFDPLLAEVFIATHSQLLAEVV